MKWSKLTREQKIARADIEVKKIYSGKNIEIECHFAGYFNEAGYEIKVNESTTDRDIILLQNLAIPYLNEILPKGNSDFGWSLSFYRSGILIDSSFPGDNMLNPDEYPEYFHEYEDEDL